MSSSISNNQNSRKKTYNARFEHLDHMREFVGKAAADSGLMPDAVYQVKLAVDEAFTNIIEHAYDGECDKEIEVICLLSKDGLTIIIKDCGLSFKPEDILDPDLDSNLLDRQVGGLGLYFIRQLMDEVDFLFDQENSHGRVCNLLRMVKRKDK
jgi:serine/threonine-protein kinase RsbW